MAADLAGFREQFPEFTADAAADAAVNRALAEAKLIHDRNSLATLFLTAHFVSLDNGTKGVGAGAGEAKAEKAGPLSVSYKTQADRGRDAAFTSTSYGRRFLTLEKRTPRWAIGAGVVG